MRHQIVNLNSLKETDRFAKFVSKHVFSGSIIMLWGEMGSGKTTFTKSFCSGLGVKSEKVISPTYTLVNIYKGRLPIFHVDLFRLNTLKDMEDFDRQDLINDEGITIVEWPKLIIGYLTNEPLLNLNFETLSNHARRIKLESNTTDFDTLFMFLKQENFFSKFKNQYKK